jgi:hypothetical protein
MVSKLAAVLQIGDVHGDELAGRVDNIGHDRRIPADPLPLLASATASIGRSGTGSEVTSG